MSARLRPRSRADHPAIATAGVAEVAAGPGHHPARRVRRLHLHAETAVDGTDLSRRTMLVRYVLRPPFAPSQISAEPDGRVSFRLSRPFRDGTTHLVWTSDAFLSRLAALVPRPTRHRLTYHGVFAPNAV